jgi:hypothetical protein
MSLWGNETISYSKSLNLVYFVIPETRRVLVLFNKDSSFLRMTNKHQIEFIAEWNYFISFISIHVLPMVC